jgi:spore coat polysaccharide biosynthesis protein SpsF (cytidylyltransferase family)
MDDAIESYCTSINIDCFRGSLKNVAERLRDAADWCNASEFMRVSGDSPLILASVADDVIKLYQENNVDLATNVQRRTFPKGFSIEVVRVNALRRAQPMMFDGEAEHVTSVFYRRPEDFRIINLSSGSDWGSIQMSVDTQADFMLIERMIAAANDYLDRLDIPALIALREHCIADTQV